MRTESTTRVGCSSTKIEFWTNIRKPWELMDCFWHFGDWMEGFMCSGTSRINGLQISSCQQFMLQEVEGCFGGFWGVILQIFQSDQRKIRLLRVNASYRIRISLRSHPAGFIITEALLCLWRGSHVDGEQFGICSLGHRHTMTCSFQRTDSFLFTTTVGSLTFISTQCWHKGHPP